MERKYIEWDEEKNNRLYDFFAQTKPDTTNFFSYQVGEGVVNFVKHYHPEISKAIVLDYGCGPGFIIEWFLKAGATTYGVDMSPETVNLVNEKFKDEERFKGGKRFDGGTLPYDDDMFDIITVTEVIEHLLPWHIDTVLSELKRILKPGGILLMTTPNDEDMSKMMVCCPECNTVFHRVGHVRSFDKATLTSLMEEHGWETVECDGTSFFEFQKKNRFSFWDLSIRMIYGCLRKLIYILTTTKEKRFKDKLGEGPNLFYMGTKLGNR